MKKVDGVHTHSNVNYVGDHFKDKRNLQPAVDNITAHKPSIEMMVNINGCYIPWGLTTKSQGKCR